MAVAWQVSVFAGPGTAARCPTRGGIYPGLSGARAILRFVSHNWGRPARDAGEGWVVVDVETSGFNPGKARVLSIAALALDPNGIVEQSVVSLLNPGVDPGPTHVHGLTT